MELHKVQNRLRLIPENSKEKEQLNIFFGPWDAYGTPGYDENKKKYFSVMGYWPVHDGEWNSFRIEKNNAGEIEIELEYIDED